jgi:hypothetical protein
MQDPQRQLNSTANPEMNTTSGESTSIPKNSVSRSLRRKAKVRWLEPQRWGEEARAFNNESGLEALQTLLGISKSKPSSTKIFNIALGCKDPVFVSIDIEGGGNSSAEKGPVRNTILIGHHIGGDLGLLTNPRGGKFKFSLRKFPIVLVLDTQIIAQRWFGASRKLKHIIVDLQVPLRKMTFTVQEMMLALLCEYC